jgi:hypothetical protein
MLTQAWYDKPGLRPVARAADAVATKMPGTDGVAVNVIYVARRVQ